MNTQAFFYSECFYHVYNRTNNKEILFPNNRNREYFKTKYEYYLSPFVKTYAYALMSNHFHFNIQIRSLKEILEYLNRLPIENKTVASKEFTDDPTGEEVVHKLIASQFSRFFNSYTKSVNKENGRTGNLFNRPFKRALLHSDQRIMGNQYYIHHNARKHGIVKQFDSYEYSSYIEILNESSSSFIAFEEVFEMYGGKKSFELFHRQENYYDSEFESLDLTGF